MDWLLSKFAENLWISLDRISVPRDSEPTTTPTIVKCWQNNQMQTQNQIASLLGPTFMRPSNNYPTLSEKCLACSGTTGLLK